ncbi:gypsy retrotransposon integrase 1-like protein [Plakobranchus ocellatus]|uniref:Gypsy retrotransposon integrase 1-like protein n=1 Tax=Plakobranchus ocellatus TaxID=259542 RepID=A0AAV4AWZ9_9GAST|nr:gypsy retrotransposon integrase 1-like protein [Plakobranchus ocellatus]
MADFMDILAEAIGQTWGLTISTASQQKQIETIRLPRLPIEQSEIISRPFDKVSIDIADPLNLMKSRNRFILTMVDAATRWPEAVPLKGISTREVVEALFGIFSRLSMPKQILSDNGKQFVSNALQAMTIIGVVKMMSTPYIRNRMKC